MEIGYVYCCPDFQASAESLVVYTFPSIVSATTALLSIVFGITRISTFVAVVVLSVAMTACVILAFILTFGVIVPVLISIVPAVAMAVAAESLRSVTDVSLQAPVSVESFVICKVTLARA